MATHINLSDVHQAIIDALKARFHRVTIDSYDPNDNLETLAPACLLNIEELPKAPDVGDGRYPVVAQLAIHCVLGREVPNLQIELQEFAVAVSQFVYEKGIWLTGSVVEKPFNIEAYPGNFRKETQGGFDSWVVNWEQKLYLGASTWQPETIKSGIRLATNPIDENDQDEYRSI
ncbi:hypothetical protein [Marinomonas aquiplantarum]|uniref:Gp37 protein n=1 Tax=Marinomonas aquiplantarum TaxID=491951 RepID=A0A366CXR2_9GAMM|nr:hypothetical protein [Marinomonas aquiplantarum]RBO82627.1 hypothetical protein DFP76_10592 [Marinomonas aquiplantarum]